MGYRIINANGISKKRRWLCGRFVILMNVLMCLFKVRTQMRMGFRPTKIAISKPPTACSCLTFASCIALSLTINLVNQVETAPWHPTSQRSPPLTGRQQDEAPFRRPSRQKPRDK